MPIDPISLSIMGMAADTGSKVGGGILNRRHANKMWKKQVAYDESVWAKNREAAVADYGRNRQDARTDWDTQNAYDSPKAQMKRLEEAGLNPALIYGNSSAAVGQSGQMQTPTMETPEYEGTARANPVDIDMSTNFAQAALAAESLRMQQQNAELQRELIKAQTLKTLGEATAVGNKNKLFSETLDKQIARWDLGNTKIQEDIYTAGQNRKESEQRIAESGKRIEKIIADTNYTVDSNQRAKIMQAAMLKKVDKETELLTKQILTEMERQLLTKAQTAKTKEERDRLELQAKLLQKDLDFYNSDKAKDWVKILASVL